MTGCRSRTTYGGDSNYLTAQVEGGSIGFVGIYTYHLGDHTRLHPWEVWVGNSFGEAAVSCSPVDHPGMTTIHSDPSDAIPMLLSCGENTASFVTVRQVSGTQQQMQLSEVTVYAPPSPGAASRPRYAPNVVARLNERFKAGRPSTILGETGLLVHMYDVLVQEVGHMCHSLVSNL